MKRLLSAILSAVLKKITWQNTPKIWEYFPAFARVIAATPFWKKSEPRDPGDEVASNSRDICLRMRESNSARYTCVWRETLKMQVNMAKAMLRAGVLSFVFICVCFTLPMNNQRRCFVCRWNCAKIVQFRVSLRTCFGINTSSDSIILLEGGNFY